jgi:hypothetical protein
MLLVAPLLLAAPMAADAAPVPAPVVAPAAAAAPDLWFVFPAEGATLDPVVLVGTDFGNGIPFFGIVPSAPLLRLEAPELPFVGRLSLMVTAVPPMFFGGVVPLTVVRGLQSSNAVDFRIL